MQQTGPNCPGGTQGAPFDTYDQQRKAEKLSETLRTVDQYFEDHGLSKNIETLNVLTASLFPCNDDEQVNWSLEFIQDAHSTVSHITEMLTKLYELRRDHLYKRSEI